MSKTKDVKIIGQWRSGTFKWKVAHGGNSSDVPAKYPKVQLPKDSGAHLIIFELSGNDTGITFSKNDPIWVQEGGKPIRPGLHPQILLAEPMDHGKKLIVVDRNDNDPAKVLQLHYQLNFDGDAPPVDPIIENGGGTVQQPPPPPTSVGFMGTGVSGFSIAAGVVLLIIGLVVGRFLR